MKSLLNRYSEFSPIVASIKENEETDAEFLGSGAESRVWRVRVDEADYVVKLANSLSLRGRPRNIPSCVQGNIDTALRGLGIAGLEQITAASFEDGATVYECAPGVSVKALNTLDGVTERQIGSLFESIEQATDAGIVFDGWNDSGGNAYFCNERGFTLIDYWDGENIRVENNIKYALRSLGAIGIQIANREGYKI